MSGQNAAAAPGIERLDPALDRLIAPDAKIETLAEGYDWSEGPDLGEGGRLPAVLRRAEEHRAPLEAG